MIDVEKAQKHSLFVRDLLGIDDCDPVEFGNLMSLKQLIDLKKIQVFKYSQLAAKKPIEKIVKMCGEDGAAILWKGNRFICLNDNRENSKYYSPYRDLFTLMHEYAHHDLGHLLDKDCIRLRSSRYDELDAEADLFVSEFLMYPESIVCSLLKCYENGARILDCPVIGRVKDNFRVSWQAIANRLHHLGIQNRHVTFWMYKTYQTRKKAAEEAGVSTDEMTRALFIHGGIEMQLDEWCKNALSAGTKKRKCAQLS